LPKRFGRQGFGHAKQTSTINGLEMSSPQRNQRRPKQREIKLMKTGLKIFTTILSVLVCFVGLPEIKAAQQVAPPPDGCYPGFTTAEGCLALQNLTTGTGNTGVGWRSLFLVGGGSFNTGVGAGTLVLNTADSNTAVGAAAMILNLSGDNNTAVGVNALAFNTGAEDNTAVGSFALANNDSTKAGLASNNTAVGAEALEFNTDGNPNTAVGYAALNSNLTAGGNTAVGYDALLFNDLLADGFPFGWYNNAVGAGALLNNVNGYSNNAFGNDALFFNVIGVANTAVGYYTLWNNDSDALGLGNNNTAVGSVALFNNVDGSENTAVGTGAGQNVITGFNNTYVGDFVGTLAVDESDTIRIGDVSNGNGAGSLQCYIGGVFNNFQPVGGSVVVVTLDRADDHLGWDFGPSQSGSAPVQRSAPQRGSAPGVRTQRPAVLDGKVDKVEKLEATVARQQKQIETLTVQLKEQAQIFTAQLKEQATQIQKVSAQLEVSKRAPQVVNNP
jgi:hypothetical protein